MDTVFVLYHIRVSVPLAGIVGSFLAENIDVVGAEKHLSHSY